MSEHKISTVADFPTISVSCDPNDAYVHARLNGISLDEVRQIVREEIRAALKERD